MSSRHKIFLTLSVLLLLNCRVSSATKNATDNEKAESTSAEKRVLVTNTKDETGGLFGDDIPTHRPLSGNYLADYPALLRKIKARRMENRRRLNTEPTWTNDHHYEYTGGDSARIFEYPTSYIPYNRPPTPSSPSPPRRPQKSHFPFGLGRPLIRKNPKPSPTNHKSKVHNPPALPPVHITHHHKYNIVYYGVDTKGHRAELPPNFSSAAPVVVSHSSAPTISTPGHLSHSEPEYDGVTYEFRIPGQNHEDIGQDSYGPPVESDYTVTTVTHETVPSSDYGAPTTHESFSIPSYSEPGNSPVISSSSYGAPSEVGTPSHNNFGLPTPGIAVTSAGAYETEIPSQGTVSSQYGSPSQSDDNTPYLNYGPPSSQGSPSASYGPPPSSSSSGPVAVGYGSLSSSPDAPSPSYGASLSNENTNIQSANYGLLSGHIASSIASGSYGSPAANNAGSSLSSTNYGPPSNNGGFNIPSTNYGGPSSGPSSPAMNYGAPLSGPSSPTMNYGAPLSGPSSPAMNYGVPPSGPSSLEINYGAPPSNSPSNPFSGPSGGYQNNNGVRTVAQESTIILPSGIELFTADDAIKYSDEWSNEDMMGQHSHEYESTPCDRIHRRKDKKPTAPQKQQQKQQHKTLGQVVRGVLSRLSPQMKNANRPNRPKKQRQAIRRAGVKKQRKPLSKRKMNKNDSSKQTSRMQPIGYKVTVSQGAQ